MPDFSTKGEEVVVKLDESVRIVDSYLAFAELWGRVTARWEQHGEDILRALGDQNPDRDWTSVTLECLVDDLIRAVREGRIHA